MERASGAFTKAFTAKFRDKSRPVIIVTGSGNNGGDGLAVARHLRQQGYAVRLLDAAGSARSPDNQANLKRAKKSGVSITQVSTQLPPDLPADGILIDALFGTGLSRPVTGPLADLLTDLNNSPLLRVAIDLPSGLPADHAPEGVVFQATHTFCLGFPKRALFAPGNSPYLGTWELVSFPVSTAYLNELPTQDFLLEAATLQPLLRQRRANDHKGTFGHALLVAGAFGTMGAAIIAGRAVLRSGAGLLTCHIPRSGYEIMQISFPEAMCKVDAHRYHLTKTGPLTAYQAIGVGPGLGTAAVTAEGLRDLFTRYDRPMVIDADALNLISKSPDLLDLVPKNSILTPHPKEFSRLFGATADDFARTQVQREIAQSKQLVLVLKTGFTSIATPSGDVFFNPTGNPGMGTAGTGDALTGILTGLLAQGYEPTVAARLGVYLHGLAGDIAAASLGQEFLLAEDVVNNLGRAFARLREA